MEAKLPTDSQLRGHYRGGDQPEGLRRLCQQEHDQVVEGAVERPALHILNTRLCQELQHDRGEHQEKSPAKFSLP